MLSIALLHYLCFQTSCQGRENIRILINGQQYSTREYIKVNAKQRSSTNQMSSRQNQSPSHNPFPDIIGDKQHMHHLKSSTSLPRRNMGTKYVVSTVVFWNNGLYIVSLRSFDIIFIGHL